MQKGEIVDPFQEKLMPEFALPGQAWEKKKDLMQEDTDLTQKQNL